MVFMVSFVSVEVTGVLTDIMTLILCHDNKLVSCGVL